MYDIQSFVKEHRNDNVCELALRAHTFSADDFKYALQQIEGWQRAQKKLPTWAQTDGIQFPPHLNMEQCSSEMTAQYKAEIVDGGENVTDLTAGFGVDAAILGKKFDYLTYVDQNETLCKIASNNLPLLGVKDFQVVCGKAEEVLQKLPHHSLIFIDPARRDANGGKVISIADCTPNVALMQERLMEHADTVMVKLSPMLDVVNMERELRQISEIHVVSVDNECKELLVKMQHNCLSVRIYCVNLFSSGDKDVFTFTRDEEKVAECKYTTEMGKYIYEPNASIMKAGCYKTLASRLGLVKLHPNSHLYTSFVDEPVKNFPGRCFKVESSSTLNKKFIKTVFGGIEKANLTVRNFPMSVAELRNKLKLREGGDLYLFATTMADEKKVLIISSSFSS